MPISVVRFCFTRQRVRKDRHRFPSGVHRKAFMQLLRTLVHSRIVLVLGVLVSILVPALTLPSLPSVSPWPVALCPLRCRALTDAQLGRRWHLRAYAESELLGLLTPGHVGADVWRMHRLTRAGLGKGDAVLSVGADRLVGALGLAV